jgi:hypothetical protein
MNAINYFSSLRKSGAASTLGFIDCHCLSFQQPTLSIEFRSVDPQRQTEEWMIYAEYLISVQQPRIVATHDIFEALHPKLAHWLRTPLSNGSLSQDLLSLVEVDGPLSALASHDFD